MTSAPLFLVRSKHRVLKARRAFGQAGQRQPVDRRAGPDRRHRIAVLAQDQRLDLRRRQLEFLRDQRAEPRRVQHRAEAIHLIPRQSRPAQRQLGQDIDRIGNDKYVGLLAQARNFYRVHDGDEQSNVAIDQIQPRFLGLAPQARRDQEQIAVGRPPVVPGVNPLVPGQRAAVHQVQRLALGQFAIRIQDLNLGHQAAALQGVRRAGADPPAAADNGHFHQLLSLDMIWSVMAWTRASACSSGPGPPAG